MKLPVVFLIAAVLFCIAHTVQSRHLKPEMERYPAGSSLSPTAIFNGSETATTSISSQSTSGKRHLSILDAAHNSSTRRNLNGYQSSNSIDECWRGDASWATDRMKLASCAVGFGSNAVGGKGGKIYVVTDSSDDAVNPLPGTLRYGVVQLSPLWIIFEKDMTITLKNELIMTSDKTIDGRGANVHIAYGPCITIQGVNNVIIHGLNVHNCKPGTPGQVRSSTAHVGYREGSDGDGITVFGATNVWIDHNSLSSCFDGLIDVIHASTAITISNNVFTDHDKVMLLGHDDTYTADTSMKVTVAFNRFGPGCVQRMPRCRLGQFHVVNNDYVDWLMYAIGGSANPTILSQGNRFLASNIPDQKEVTKRDCLCGLGTWSQWSWTTVNDMFLNGAFFVQSGNGAAKPNYGLSHTGTFLPAMTAGAGSLSCSAGHPC